MTEPADDRAAASPREVVEHAHRLAREGDIRGEADLYARDGVLEWPFAPPGVPRHVHGREEIRRLFAKLEDGIRQTGVRVAGLQESVVVHETHDPEVVIVEFDVQGELTATGETFQAPYIQVFRVRDGEIVLFRDYFGAATAQQVAAIFAPAGPAGPLGAPATGEKATVGQATPAP